MGTHGIGRSSITLAAVAILIALASGTLAAAQDAPARPWWLSGQLNVIYEWHPAFRAPYTGLNSLRPAREHATSTVATLYSGLRLGSRTELVFDLESAGGRGISDAFGLAGFTDLDVVRNPSLGSAPYIARAYVRYTIGLTPETETHPAELHALLPRVPVRRVSIGAGKIGVVDFFDLNSAGSDSHLQFLNWTVDNNGAYDYAADTRGYTIGVVAELRDRVWAARWAEALMPKVANGIDYDWDLAHEHADNLEIELDRGLIPHHEGAVRLLAYVNHANMGSYREAIDAFLGARDSVLDVAAHRRRGRTKPGIGLNLEQDVGHDLTFFGRIGINDGRVESFAYTEVDRTLELGLGWTSLPWRRADRVGIALVRNALGTDHREYLARGGHGFLLGDGALNYGPERILEGYYTLATHGGVSFAFDIQHIADPGYNRDRGPVTVFGLRVHIDVPHGP